MAEPTQESIGTRYVRDQKNGRCDGRYTSIKIRNRIIGLNAVVVQRTYVEKSEGDIKDGEPEMTLFEFKTGKYGEFLNIGNAIKRAL